VLTIRQRQMVEQAIREQCRYRGWVLHALGCRTTHVHAVVSAAGRSPNEVLRAIKAWCSRQLSDGDGGRNRWWTKGGSMRRLYDTAGIANVVTYVVECQDQPRA
jgi:REP element-mobilizing transposase RayT